MILDTNALSAFVDGDMGVGRILRQAARAAIPGVVPGEFRYGIAQSRHRRARDAWIAALALQHDLPILSRDGHFDAVRGIDRAQW